MKSIKLPILFMTEEQHDLAELEIEWNEEESEVREMTFYHIDAIAPRKTAGEGKTTLIYTAGTSFACKLSYSEVESIINQTMLTSHP